mgnify:CR=1 FL=1
MTANGIRYANKLTNLDAKQITLASDVDVSGVLESIVILSDQEGDLTLDIKKSNNFSSIVVDQF